MTAAKARGVPRWREARTRQERTCGPNAHALTGQDELTRTAFVTCHAALLQPLALCVVYLTWVRCCRTPLHSCQKRVLGFASIQRCSSESLPPLDRSCVFHSCWLGSTLGADNAALFFLMSQLDYNLVQNLFALRPLGSEPLPLLPQCFNAFFFSLSLPLHLILCSTRRVAALLCLNFPEICEYNIAY